MAIALGLIGIVLVLTAMWLAAILVDRHLKKHWDEVLEAHWAEWHNETVEEDPLTPEREDELS